MRKIGNFAGVDVQSWLQARSAEVGGGLQENNADQPEAMK